MINFKNISIEDLKKDYSERKGFVFQSPVRSSDQAIENLCNVLIKHDVTKEYPEAVIRINDNTTAFVYNDFDSPYVFKMGMMGIQLGMFKVETLYNFIKTI